MADGNLEYLTLGQLLRVGCVRALHANVHRLANVLQASVAQQRAGEQSGFTQNLKSVADAQHQSASSGELAYRLHDRGKLGDGAGAEVVPVGKSTGHDDGVASLQVRRIVPEEGHRLPGHFRNY